MNRVMSSLLVILAAFVAEPCMGFAPMHNVGRVFASVPSTLNNHVVMGASLMDAMDFVTKSASAVDVDALVVSSSVLISETEAWVQPLSNVLGPFLNFFSFAMVSELINEIEWSGLNYLPSVVILSAAVSYSSFLVSNCQRK